MSGTLFKTLTLFLFHMTTFNLIVFFDVQFQRIKIYFLCLSILIYSIYVARPSMCIFGVWFWQLHLLTSSAIFIISLFLLITPNTYPITFLYITLIVRVIASQLYAIAGNEDCFKTKHVSLLVKRNNCHRGRYFISL